MQRTFNYTGRRKIEQAEALFSFAGEENSPYFNVDFRLDTSNIPEDAKVYVEAHYKETRQRYDFGSVSRIVPPSDRTLAEVDLSGPTIFSVLIVDESREHGLLLASGTGFRADKGEEEKDKTSLLAVVRRPLGQLTWRVEFNTGNGVPELSLNSAIPNVIDKMKSDSFFQSLVLPAALREVLMFYLWSGEESESSEKWLSFAEYFGGSKPESEDPIDTTNWIDDVVSEFSVGFSFCDRLLARISETSS